MKFFLLYTAFITGFLLSCGSKKEIKNAGKYIAPQVMEQGNTISFPDTTEISFFETETIGNALLNNSISVPARVAAMVLASGEGASQNVILFDNADLASSYTALLQNIAIVKQKRGIALQKKAVVERKKTEVTRFKDLADHGASTGKEVADAQVDLLSAETDLAMAQSEISNEKTAIIENEAKLKMGGFDPVALKSASAGTAYIISDIPENQLDKIKEGNPCTIQFISFPNDRFTGHIDDVADMIDPVSRMVKLRVSLHNPKIKAGMFATVSFGVSEGNQISISKNSLVTVQGKNYVFVKTGSNLFNRKEVNAGSQVGERIIIYTGLHNGEVIVTKGVMQLKGLSFGY